MTREELEQEAEEWLCNNLHSANEEDFIKAMVDIAEPREKRIAELIALINAERERQEKCDDVHLRKIAELEKENAELKKEWQEQVQKATDEGYARTLQTIQLSKARELLKQWVELYKPKLEGYPITPIQEQTEQFLKETEK